MPVVSKVVRRAAHLAPSGPKADARPACASLERAPSPAVARGLFEKFSEPSTVGRAAGSVTTTYLVPHKEYLNQSNNLVSLPTLNSRKLAIALHNCKHRIATC